MSLHKIATPENVDLHLELAGLGNRLQAKLIDWVVKWLPVLLLFCAVALIAVIMGEAFSAAAVTSWMIAGLTLLLLAYAMCWEIFFEARWNGQTPGKIVAGIRVVDADGYPLSIQAIILRNLIALADFLPGFYLLGGILVLVSQRSQRLGDMAAGTIVIREREAGEARVLFEGESYLTVEDPIVRFTPDQIAAFGNQDRRLLKDFFVRAGEMEGEARFALSNQVCANYWKRGGFAEEYPRTENERAKFLKELYLALRGSGH